MDFQVTPTISTGQILLMITFVGTVIGTAMSIYFKLKEKWLTGQMDIELRLKQHYEKITAEQTAKLEDCIHKISGHPLSDKKVL